MIGHVAPEAFDGGPIAAVQEGDLINIDIENRKIELEVPADVIAKRLDAWKQPVKRYPSGVFAKYVALVSSASQGAVTSQPK
jgi:dihydroxy-acid dehydratase